MEILVVSLPLYFYTTLLIKELHLKNNEFFVYYTHNGYKSILNKLLEREEQKNIIIKKARNILKKTIKNIEEGVEREEKNIKIAKKEISDFRKEYEEESKQFDELFDEIILYLDKEEEQDEKSNDLSEIFKKLVEGQDKLEKEEEKREEQKENFDKVIENYLLLLRMYPKRFKRIDTPKKLFKKVFFDYKNRLEIPFDGEDFKNDGTCFSHEEYFFVVSNKEAYLEELDVVLDYKVLNGENMFDEQNEDIVRNEKVSEYIENNIQKIAERGFEIAERRRAECDRWEIVILNNPYDFRNNFSQLKYNHCIPRKNKPQGIDFEIMTTEKENGLKGEELRIRDEHIEKCMLSKIKKKKYERFFVIKFN